MVYSALRVDEGRLWDTHMQLAEIGALSHGGCRRLALSDEDRIARDLFVAWCRQAGCTIDIDRAGNIYATRPGRRAAPPVATGSHLDTQPHGGRFDGIYGVLAGLEILRTLNDAGITTDLPLAVVNWTNEEGVRFPAGVLGSSAYAGRRSVADLWRMTAVDGPTFGDELRRTGYAGEQMPGSFAMSALFEAHIEQGPVLERENVPIGIVHKVQGLRWFEVTVEGADRHAGTTPMDMRQDSLVAAARMVLDLCELGQTHAPDARITVGRLDVDPNAGSTIPGKTMFIIDLRHPEGARLDRLEQEIVALCDRAAARHDVRAHCRRLFDVAPIDFDPACVTHLEQAAGQLGLASRRMLSGAIHDAAVIGQIVPAAMLFVPCRDGISHNEAEWAEPEHLAAGANVLLHAMLARAGIAEASAA